LGAGCWMAAKSIERPGRSANIKTLHSTI
jgi:hypothetical protein